jgi:hypothetical protein
MRHRLFVRLVPIRPFHIVFARKVTAFAAMVYFPFLTADTEIDAAAAAFPKAILCRIPAALAQWRLFQHRLGAFVFVDPTHASEPRDHRFRRIHILFHGDFVLAAFAAVDAASC